MVFRCADGIEDCEEAEQIDLPGTQGTVHGGADEQKEKWVNAEQIPQANVFGVAKNKKTDE